MPSGVPVRHAFSKRQVCSYGSLCSACPGSLAQNVLAQDALAEVPLARDALAQNALAQDLLWQHAQLADDK